MSLTPIVEAFGMVALVFIAAGAVSVRLAGWVWGGGGGVSSPPSSPPGWIAAIGVAWLPAAAEAFFLVLLAALWFGSLGHGGWLMVFLLVGALASGADRWLGHRLRGTPARQELAAFAVGLAKYLLAGWLCVWRLS